MFLCARCGSCNQEAGLARAFVMTHESTLTSAVCVLGGGGLLQLQCMCVCMCVCTCAPEAASSGLHCGVIRQTCFLKCCKGISRQHLGPLVAAAAERGRQDRQGHQQAAVQGSRGKQIQGNTGLPALPTLCQPRGQTDHLHESGQWGAPTPCGPQHPLPPPTQPCDSHPKPFEFKTECNNQVPVAAISNEDVSNTHYVCMLTCSIQQSSHQQRCG